jgi:hypothetical protein
VAPILLEQFKLIPQVWGFFMDILARMGLVSN